MPVGVDQAAAQILIRGCQLHLGDCRPVLFGRPVIVGEAKVHVLLVQRAEARRRSHRFLVRDFPGDAALARLDCDRVAGNAFGPCIFDAGESLVDRGVELLALRGSGRHLDRRDVLDEARVADLHRNVVQRRRR